MSLRLHTWVFACSLALVALLPALTRTQAARTVQDGVFTDEQAARGDTLYAAQCAFCHGSLLEGAQGPPLAGEAFLGTWSAEPLVALGNKIFNTMPPGGGLTAGDTADLIAHILRTGGFPSGPTELSGEVDALALITWPGGTDALDQASAETAGALRAFRPIGSMAQLMRGVFFPNSNLIFTVQTRDPAAPTPPREPDAADAAGFSGAEWGAGIYTGWQLVDTAAVARADATPLMLRPGARCANGRPAPVDDPDWIRYTEELIAVSERIYGLSQMRDQEAVSEATADLADACFNCHRAYRDVFARGQARDPNNPGANPGRCMPRSQ
jgi:quinoprotein glucose dehydrogenase